jgi:hypothetical protein
MPLWIESRRYINYVYHGFLPYVVHDPALRHRIRYHAKRRAFRSGGSRNYDSSRTARGRNNG